METAISLYLELYSLIGCPLYLPFRDICPIPFLHNRDWKEGWKMHILPLKTIRRFIMTAVVLSLPAIGSAQSDTDFPCTIGRTVEKQKVYPYAFQDIWQTALILVREREVIELNKLKKKGLDPVRSRIKSNRDAGLITVMLTHKGKKGLFRKEQSLFSYQGVLIEPLGIQKTSVSYQEMKFRSYDNYLFHGGQLARYIDFTPSEENILETIHERLQEESHESR